MAGRRHVGIIDSEKSAALAEEHLRRFRLQQAKDWQQKQWSNNIFIMDKDSRSYAEKESQAGLRMDYRELEKKLKKLQNGPKFIFKEVPNRPGWKALMYEKPDGTLQYISAYAKIKLPEFSTIIVKEKIERDFTMTHLNHLDMPKTAYNEETKRFETTDGSLKPGWIRTYESHGEDPNDFESRGWRTVLLRLQATGYAGINEIEKIFGRSYRKSWAQSAGHRNNLGYIL